MEKESVQLEYDSTVTVERSRCGQVVEKEANIPPPDSEYSRLKNSSRMRGAVHMELYRKHLVRASLSRGRTVAWDQVGCKGPDKHDDIAQPCATKSINWIM